MSHFSKKINTLRFTPALGWAGVIFYLSHQPGRDIGLDPFIQDLIAIAAHTVEYGMFTILILWALKFKTTKKQTMTIFGIVILFAVSDEWHQSFIPGRTPTLFDIGVDALASASVLYASHVFSGKLDKILKK